MLFRAFLYFGCMFALCGCSKPTSWVYTDVESSSGFVAPARIQALTSVDFVQLEMSRTDEVDSSIVSHLNFLYTELPPSEGIHPDLVNLKIEGTRGNQSFLCTRLKGGERLLLSREATLFLIEALKTSPEITFVIGETSVQLSSEGFAAAHSRLNKIKTSSRSSPTFGLDFN